MAAPTDGKLRAAGDRPYAGLGPMWASAPTDGSLGRPVTAPTETGDAVLWQKTREIVYFTTSLW